MRLLDQNIQSTFQYKTHQGFLRSAVPHDQTPVWFLDKLSVEALRPLELGPADQIDARRGDVHHSSEGDADRFRIPAVLAGCFVVEGAEG